MDTNGSEETKCLKCNLNFTSSKTLKIHQQEKHSQSVIKCFKCGLRFSNQEKFRIHWNNRHVTVSKTPVATNDALTISDDESKEKPKETSSITAPNTKNRVHKFPTSNRCNVCYKAFSSQQTAELHYRRVHMDWTVNCEICNKPVKKNLYLKTHLKAHRVNGEISIERILELQKEAIQKRKKSHKMDDKFERSKICPDCGKEFTSSAYMKIHWSKMHLNKKQTKAAKPKPKSRRVVLTTDCDDSADDDSENGDEFGDEVADADLTAKILVPTPCPECGKILGSESGMKKHRYQAHTKKAALKLAQKKKKAALRMNSKKTSFPSIKSLSDLRSSVPDINFDSNVCPICKKTFGNNIIASKHFKIVHRKESAVKCPYPQCFVRCSTTPNLRTHWVAAHPRAPLPQEFALTRAFKTRKRKRDLEKENNPQPNTLNISNTRNTITSTATIGGDTLDKHQEQKEIETTNHEMNDTIVPKKENNPLLKMFEKIREKNANSPVRKPVLEVIEIEEEQNEEGIGGCLTLDFEHCSMCDKNFSSKEAAMMHYNHKHPDEMQICPECDMLIAKASAMSYHFKTKHPMVAIPLFLKSTRSIGYTIEMFALFNKEECDICKQKFKSIVESQRHFSEEHEIIFELCSICMKSFRTESRLVTHWAEKHEDQKFVAFKAPTSMEEVDDVNDQFETEKMDQDSEVQPNEQDAQNDENEEIKDDPAPDLQCAIKVSNVKSLKRVKYPFIIENTCPICDQTYKTRKSTVSHYKTVHAVTENQCEKCLTNFAQVDHLKEHWLLAHENAPWKDTNGDQEDNNSKNDKILTNVEKDSDTDPKNPKFNVVVSLVNINNDLDSLTPEIRSQFLKISKEIVNATAETEPIPAGKEEKIFVTMETDDEAALLQNEPLDLSTSYNKHQTDQSEPMEFETVNIKYESSNDLIFSLDTLAQNTSQKEMNSLANNDDVVVKDEIIFEDSTVGE